MTMPRVIDSLFQRIVKLGRASYGALSQPSRARNHGLMNCRSIVVCLAVIGLSGCAVTPSFDDAEAARTLPGAFYEFLASAPAGASVFLTESPWGPRVTVIARRSYFAASGRTCRNLTIAQKGMRRSALACRLPDGTWEKVRTLIGGGELLSPAAGPPLERRAPQ